MATDIYTEGALNLMLTAIKDEVTLTLEAREGGSAIASSSVDFNPASGASMLLDGSVTITVPASTVESVRLQSPITGTITDVVLSSPAIFPSGGDLIVSVYTLSLTSEQTG